MKSKFSIPLFLVVFISLLIGLNKIVATSNDRKTPLLIKIYYFNFAGRGESIRLACSYGGLTWEDVRLSGQQFQEMKSQGLLPFGQLPVIEVTMDDGSVTQIAQSSSILKFVGKFAGLYPVNDDFQAARIDGLLAQESDLFAGLTVSKYKERFGFGHLTEADVAIVRASLNNEVLPRHLAYFERILNASTSQWLAGGTNPSIVDFVLVPGFKSLTTGAIEGISPSILENYPKILSLIAKFDSMPEVVAYNSKK